MPNRDGYELIAAVKQRFPKTPIIAMSGDGVFSGAEYLKMAAAIGVDACLQKPFASDSLLATVDAVLRQSLGAPTVDREI